MIQQSAALKAAAETAVDEVVEDAIRLLELHHRLGRAEGEAREELEIELETQLISIRIHAGSAQEALDALTDALPDDDE